MLRETRLFRSLILSAAVALVPACGGCGPDGRARAGHAARPGEWEIVSADSNGEPPPPGRLTGARFAVAGDQLTLLGKEGSFARDATRTPRPIDFVRGSTRQLGIYELDGDTLKLCVGPADDRPKEFQTKPGRTTRCTC